MHSASLPCVLHALPISPSFFRIYTEFIFILLVLPSKFSSVLFTFCLHSSHKESLQRSTCKQTLHISWSVIGHWNAFFHFANKITLFLHNPIIHPHPPDTSRLSSFLSVRVATAACLHCTSSFEGRENTDVNWERACLDGNFTVRALSLSTEKARRREDKTHLSSLIKWFSDIKCLKGNALQMAALAEPLRHVSTCNTHLACLKGRLWFLYSDEGTHSRVETSSGALHTNSNWRTMQNFRRYCKLLMGEKSNVGSVRLLAFLARSCLGRGKTYRKSLLDVKCMKHIRLQRFLQTFFAQTNI
jgi:hypothetical protein